MGMNEKKKEELATISSLVGILWKEAQRLDLDDTDKVTDAISRISATVADLRGSASILDDLHNDMIEIEALCSKVMKRDATRGEVKDALGTLLEQVEEKMAEVERVGKLRNFLLACAEHAEELADILNIKDFF